MMDSQVFAGTYEDAAGVEAITWRLEGSDRCGIPRLEVSTTIRAVPVWGFDFDGLEPADPHDPRARTLTLNSAGELHDCVLGGDLPCSVIVAGQRRDAAIRFALDLRHDAEAEPHRSSNLRLSMAIDTAIIQVTDEWFEDGLLRLQDALPPHIQLMCCVTCQYSDYSPAGHGLMGMRCHRDAKQRYLAVKSKADYWSVPVTEEVPETYRCPDYQRRIAGTGYRG
jgi:Family of unknown function (DUF6304)